MKQSLKLLVALAVVACSATSAFAQKTGHINVQELIQVMPETEAANKQLEAVGNALREELQALDTELKNKTIDYTNKRATLTEPVANERFKDLQSLSQRLEEQTQAAEQDFQNKRNELYAPVYEKAKNTINKVAKANGFTYIISTDALVYVDTTTASDLLPLVKKELGITK